jgi:beta-carotene hydroxylase
MEQKPSKEELEIISKYIGNFSWATFIAGVLCIALVFSFTLLSILGHVPIWAGSLVNAICFFSLFDTLHNAMHGQIAGRHKKLKWIDKTIGHIAGMIVQLGYKGWKEQHMVHHANTNVIGIDPNCFQFESKKSLISFVFKGYIAMHLYAVPLIGKKLLNNLMGSKRYKYFTKNFPDSWVKQIQLNYLFMIIATALGFGWHVVWLWILPSFIQRIRIHFLFIWSPHKNIADTNRFKNTTIHIRPFGLDRIYSRQVLDYHLIHHLYPAIPSNKLRRVYLEVRHILEANGSPIYRGWFDANQTGLK